MAYMTWNDLWLAGLRFLGSSSADDRRYVKEAVRTALDRVAGDHSWNHLLTRYRLNMVAPYTTGTVAVTSGGTTVTLTGGTWPTWAASGEITIGSEEPVYQVASRTSGSVIVLASDTPFDGDDDETEATYGIQRCTYDLPADFRTMYLPHGEVVGPLLFLSPDEWLRRRRQSPGTQGTPLSATVMASPDTDERMAIFIDPPSDSVETVDVIYSRWPYSMAVDYATGTVSTTADSTTVTGVGTTFADGMVGSVLRLGTAAAAPDDMTGDNAYAEELLVDSVTDTTHLETKSAVAATHSGVKYRISSRVLLSHHVCYEAIRRAIELEINQFFPGREGLVVLADTAYNAAIVRARCKDSAVSSSANMGPLRTQRYYEMPLTVEPAE